MTSQTRKILVLTGAGLLIAILTKAGKKNMQFSNFKAATAQKLGAIYAALIDRGLNPLQLRLALAQILHETGEFTKASNVARLNNNFSGIKWINKPYQKASKGSPVPPSERVPGNAAYNFYAKFDTLQDWAVDYVRILNLRAKPIQARDIDDFLNRLAQNRYYDIKGRNAYEKRVKEYFEKLV